jgi:hypothetical protein
MAVLSLLTTNTADLAIISPIMLGVTELPAFHTFTAVPAMSILEVYATGSAFFAIIGAADMSFIARLVAP